MSAIHYASRHAAKYEEVRRLLAGIELRHASDLELPAPEVADPDALLAAATARAIAAHAALGAPCIVEESALHREHDDAPLHGLDADALVEQHDGEAVVARVAVGYTADGRRVEVFGGELAGAIIGAHRATDAFGWDAVFAPEGYPSGQTLHAMRGQKFVVNMRRKPYLELLDHLTGRPHEGVFEAHVTVLTESLAPERVERFRATVAGLGAKPVFIELPAGEVPRQLMTSSYHAGAVDAVRTEVFALADAIARDGFAVTRVKIEALLKANRGLPQTAEEALALGASNYFEFHVKVKVPVDGGAATPGLDRLRRLADGHGAHLSRNAFRKGDAHEQRFVTLRLYRVGQPEAEGRFETLLDALRGLGFPFAKVLREYAVYDSNVALDAGWIDGGVAKDPPPH